MLRKLFFQCLYAMDISKHAKPEILGRIHQVWNSIPQQLAKSNKKFVYGDIQKGARAKDFSAFKLFLLDHGLMGAMVDAPVSEILLGGNVFEEYKGTFTEQYVLEQLKCYAEDDVFYYDNDSSKLELDFLIQKEGVLVPIEVKAKENLRSKSLAQFHKDHPEAVPVRLSMSGYRRQEWLTNFPLYAACRVAGRMERDSK